MSSKQIHSSGFSLAKRKQLTGDDFYDIKTIGDLTIAIVCDGVGSAQEGALAAKRTTSYLLNNFTIRPKSWSIEKTIKTFIRSINEILYQESQIDYGRSELVTTLAMVVIEGNRLYGANVGDSRIYLLRESVMDRLSLDHVMDEKGFESVLTKAIGIEHEVEPYYFENNVQKEDKILLCSDGLYNVLDADSIRSSLSLGASLLVKKASTLSDDDLPDDTTAVVLEIQKADEKEVYRHQEVEIPRSLNVGELVDGYTLKKALIQNKRTWLCEKKGKQYVLKFAPLEAIDDTIILDLFVKEAWNAKRLKADFFPKAVIPKNRTYRYYVMQMLEGESLETYLTHKRLSIDDVVHLAKTLLNMSHYLLTKDLVHGDIKPANIIVGKDAHSKLTFKIIDFGSITQIFSIDSKAGTPSFLSPQRFQNEAISESSELFAIGVTLYRALTQKYPYGEIEPFQTPLFKEAKKPSRHNSNIPDWLDSVILRSIALSKNRRYSHYSEMMFELHAPSKVKPYFNENTPLIEREPLMFYKVGFTLMTIVNIVLLLQLLK